MGSTEASRVKDKLKALHGLRSIQSQIVDEALKASTKYDNPRDKNKWIDKMNRTDYEDIDVGNTIFKRGAKRKGFKPRPKEMVRHKGYQGIPMYGTKEVVKKHNAILKRYFPDSRKSHLKTQVPVTVRERRMGSGVLGSYAWTRNRLTGEVVDHYITIDPYKDKRKGTITECMVHEWNHFFRSLDKRRKHLVWNRSTPKEEQENVAETTIRLGYQHLNRPHSPNYYQARRIRPYPQTRKADRNLLVKKTAHNSREKLRGLLRKEKSLKKKVPDTKLAKHWHRGKDLSAHFKTSEGEHVEFFLSGKKKINPRRLANWIDREDGWVGEETVWQIMPNGKRKRLVKKNKRPKKVRGKRVPRGR